jgi:hypothetical protein
MKLIGWSLKKDGWNVSLVPVYLMHEKWIALPGWWYYADNATPTSSDFLSSCRLVVLNFRWISGQIGVWNNPDVENFLWWHIGVFVMDSIVRSSYPLMLAFISINKDTWWFYSVSCSFNGTL